MENHDILKLAAQQLRRAARTLNVIRRRGDIDGQINLEASACLTSANLLDGVARDLRPAKAVEDWNRGMGPALKNYHPYQGGQPKHG